MEARILAEAFYSAENSPQGSKERSDFEAFLDTCARELITEHRATFVTRNKLMPGIIKSWEVESQTKKLFEEDLAKKVTGTIFKILTDEEGYKLSTSIG